MDYQTLSDTEVIELARQGRPSAFRELVGRYERPVFSLVYRMVENRQQAEDLAQDTFLKVHRALDRYDPRYKFSSWIFKIAHNTTLDAIRKKTPRTLSIDGSPYAETEAEARASAPVLVSTEETPEQYTESREIGRELEDALSKLRVEYRTVIVLRHVEGRPYAEIAEITGLPLGTVKTYIHRARRELRHMLEHLRS